MKNTITTFVFVLMTFLSQSVFASSNFNICNANLLSDTQLEVIVENHVKTFDIKLNNENSIDEIVSVLRWSEFQTNPFGLLRLMNMMAAFDPKSDDIAKVLSSFRNNKVLSFSANKYKWHRGLAKIVNEFNYSIVAFKFSGGVSEKESLDESVLSLKKVLEGHNIKVENMKLSAGQFPPRSLLSARVYRAEQVKLIEEIAAKFKITPEIQALRPALREMQMNLWTPLALESYDIRGHAIFRFKYDSENTDSARRLRVLKRLFLDKGLVIFSESAGEAIEILATDRRDLLEINNIMNYLIHMPKVEVL